MEPKHIKPCPANHPNLSGSKCKVCHNEAEKTTWGQIQWIVCTSTKAISKDRDSHCNRVTASWTSQTRTPGFIAVASSFTGNANLNTRSLSFCWMRDFFFNMMFTEISPNPKIGVERVQYPRKPMQLIWRYTCILQSTREVQRTKAASLDGGSQNLCVSTSHVFHWELLLLKWN